MRPAVGDDVEGGQLVENLRQMLLGARVVVIPGVAEAAASSEAAAAALPTTQAHERDASVVRRVGTVAIDDRLRACTRCGKPPEESPRR
jgi:hypothetical protein